MPVRCRWLSGRGVAGGLQIRGLGIPAAVAGPRPWPGSDRPGQLS